MPPGLGHRLLGSLLLGMLVAVVVAVVAIFLLGRPPKTFSMAAGAEGGMYQGFAADLQAELARRGFRLEIIETDGSIENAQLVRDGEADIALVQSGTEILTEVGDATALAEVFYEPLFIFARADLPIVDGVPSLQGATINIGPAGSGTNALTQGLITLSGLSVIMLSNETADSVDMLRDGTIDAAAFVVAPNAPIIAELVAIPDLQIIEIVRSEAISRRLPFLSAVTMQRAVLDVARDVPPRDTEVLAARATIIARDGLHPDLARLVVAALPAAMPQPWVGDLHAFPSLADTGFPVNEDARKFLVDGPTPLEGFLPFEVASPLSRIYLILLPLLVLAFPLWTLVRASSGWFLRSRITNWYPRIHAIERGVNDASLEQLREQRDFLGSLVTEMSSKTRVPAGYLAAYYDLGIDIEYVTRRVDARIAQLESQAGTGTPDAGTEPPDAAEA